MKRRGTGGFSLMELLIVVAIVGILAGMAIVNYWLGLQRARQRRTMADIRAIAVAWEARAADMKGYGVAGWSMPPDDIDAAAINGLLTPTYLRSVPVADGWGRPMGFALDSSPSTYAIRSAGADGVFETSYTPGTTTKFDCDIVYSGGSFICSPAQ